MKKKTRNPGKEELYRLYVNEFKSIPKIADILECGTTTVHRWLKSEHIKIRTSAETRLNGIIRPSNDVLYKLYIIDRIGYVEISKKMGVSPPTAKRWLEDAGIEIRNMSESHFNGKQKPTDDELNKMYLIDGMTTVDIGKMYGVCGKTVWRWLTACGISTRSHKEAKMFGKQKPSKTELHKMYIIEKMSTHHIAKHVGVQPKVICTWLHEYDISIRTVSDALIVGNYRGKNSPNWKGGQRGYCHRFNFEYKEKIRARYNRECFVCGTTEEDNGRRLDVHHTNYRKDCLCNNVKCLFVPLCVKCHRRTGGKRWFWERVITYAYAYWDEYYATDLNIEQAFATNRQEVETSWNSVFIHSQK